MKRGNSVALGLQALQPPSVNIASMTQPDIPVAEVKRLRKISQQAETARNYRDMFIRQLHADGHSLRAIAEATGTLTHSAIARIVKR